MEMLEAFHPPLFYLSAAGLVKLGVSWQGVTWLSVVCGAIRFVLIWYGLERHLGNRVARVATLALVAILPISVHVDGMIYGEPILGMFSVAAMLLWVEAFRAIGRRRWRIACLLGLTLGLALLTKASTLVLMITLGVAVALELLAPTKPYEWRIRLRALLPWAAALAICLALSGWFYARNAAQHGKPFLSSFDLTQSGTMARINGATYMDRRTLGFLGWDTSIYRSPYYPTATEPHGRFFTIAMASTFIDYYNISFSGLPPDYRAEGNLQANNRPITPWLDKLARRALRGGTVILLASLIAWTVCLWKIYRQRDWGLFAALLAPLFTTLAAMHFAVEFPFDTAGVIKGAYMQFGMPAFYAMFGLSVAWAAAKPRRWPALAVLLLGLGAVAAYSICCRTGLLLPV
jgi:4-amino-4-deoxy-L-arabinose transferase-like glycosyltransferase